jgi:hypothetical protein
MLNWRHEWVAVDALFVLCISRWSMLHVAEPAWQHGIMCGTAGPSAVIARTTVCFSDGKGSIIDDVGDDTPPYQNW